MANKRQNAILKNGVDVWNEWRGKNPQVRPDLDSANLFRAHLYKANLNGVNLHKANLGKANLRQGNLRWANLRCAILEEADLRWSKFDGADMRGAKLLGADLFKADLFLANLTGADLRRVNLTNAIIGGTIFGDVDLSSVDGLDTVTHRGPSIIAVDTIYKSKGNIPEAFLRGAGVPENLITFMHSLAGKAFEFYSCFISHSAKDKRFCERLYADLQAKGVRVWYFPEDAKWGETIWGEIDRSIKVYDKLIVVCSANSLQSGPVNREIERALNREDKEGKGILFPIRIDDYIFNTWEHERKADILRKVVGDFSGWDKDAARYDKAFDKLLKGLQAGT